MLKVTVIRDRRGYQGQVIPRDAGGYEAYTVDRVLSKNPFGIGSDASVTVVAPDATLDPNKYWLRFKAWGGETITYF